MQLTKDDYSKLLSMPVVVAALGYFVDIYDLLLFGIVRVESLQAIGVSGEGLLTNGEYLIRMQMTGLLLGGILWGVLGDKRGRLSVLFGSILIYSLANIANGFVTSVDQYAWLRLVAGIGLAGELGAGITLVAEVLPTRLRGYGTTLVATFGLFGAIAANSIAHLVDWRTCYFIGGGLGLVLLITRISVMESAMFNSVKAQTIARGNLLQLFRKDRLVRFIGCVLIGLPIWFVVGILILFSPEFAQVMGIKGVSAGDAVMISYAGLAAGDLTSGLSSQLIRSRKRAVKAFILLTLLFILIYLYVPLYNSFWFYTACFGLGFAVGYWALFVTIATEQFGTNLRATVTTAVPNLIRGTLVPITWLFGFTRGQVGLIHGAALVGLFTIVVAWLSLRLVDETFHKDMDFLEEK